VSLERTHATAQDQPLAEADLRLARHSRAEDAHVDSLRRRVRESRALLSPRPRDGRCAVPGLVRALWPQRPVERLRAGLAVHVGATRRSNDVLRNLGGLNVASLANCDVDACLFAALPGAHAPSSPDFGPTGKETANAF
jgi:hypothetical protein